MKALFVLLAVAVAVCCAQDLLEIPPLDSEPPLRAAVLSRCTHEKLLKGECSEESPESLYLNPDAPAKEEVHGADRKLLAAETPLFQHPVFIPMGNKQSSHRRAVNYLWPRLHTRQSAFVMYPYAFTQNNPAGKLVYDQGAIISVNLTDFPRPEEQARIFSYIEDETNITMTRAQAIYDSSIAILMAESLEIPLITYEATQFCSPLYNYIGGKYTKCWKYADYIAKLPTNKEETSVVYVSPREIAAGALYNNGMLRFGMLIIPDIYVGMANTINNQLDVAGRAAVKKFVEDGGTIYASAKGATVLEGLGFTAAGSFDTRRLYKVWNENGVQYKAAGTRGCAPEEMPPVSDATEESWVERALCFGLNQMNLTDQGLPWPTYTTLYSAPFMNASIARANNWKIVSYYDPAGYKSHMQFSDAQTGVSTDIPASASYLEYPHVLYKPWKKGHVIAHLDNVVQHTNSFQWLFSALLLANSHPLFLNSEIKNGFKQLPAMEQYAVGVQLEIKNFYNLKLQDAAHTVWVANGLDVIGTLPAGCVKKDNPTATPPLGNLNTTFNFDCTPTNKEYAAFDVQRFVVTVFIRDITITQIQNNVVLLYDQVNYVPEPNSFHTEYKREYMEVPITVNMFMAALIRSDVNPDPSSHYPIRGRGQYIDNVMNAENKEDTEAYEVQHTAIVPLISPVVDGDNQALIAHTYDFDWLYYNQYKFPYPFGHHLNPRDYDILDFRTFGKRHNEMAVDWDTSVRIEKAKRNATLFGLEGQYQDMNNISMSQYQTNMDSDSNDLTQIDFWDSDRFYEHGTQRILSFFDTSKPEPFEWYDVPASWPGGVMNPAYKNPRKHAMKVQLSFTQNNIYFYDTIQKLPLPAGIPDANWALTMDRYDNKITACKPNREDVSKSIPVPGYFSSLKVQDQDYPRGLKPNEYGNELLQWCTLYNHQIKIDEKTNELATKTGGQVKLMHYLVRMNDNPDIISGDDVMYMKQDGAEWYYAPDEIEKDARFGNYTELRMKYTYGADLFIPCDMSRKGGLLKIDMPDDIQFGAGTDFVNNNPINFAADQISVVNSVFEAPTATIKTKFYRGNMPNEQYGKGSFLQIDLESLARTGGMPDSFEAEVSLDELIYDLSLRGTDTDPFTASFERFEARKNFTQKVTFRKMLVLRLPALKLHFQRADRNESKMMAYEFLEPFVRYGVYMQELMAHRTVYGSAEIHPVSDPGLVATSAGMAWISHVGISSIPFREYLTTGSKQMIPSCSETGRVEWKDMWGRQWSQPIRSVFVDVPPIPPPLRNFMMTTTFELIDPTTGVRQLEWRSDSPALVRAHVKLLNNYPKWWEITVSQANQITQLTVGGVKRRIFDYEIPDLTNVLPDTETRKDLFISLGHKASYGSCYQTPSVTLNGTCLDGHQEMFDNIKNVRLCLGDWTPNCDSLVAGMNYGVARRRGDGTQTWNYAKQVNDYWPTNYIKPNMWDLTHYDYDDTPFDKAYKYHMDNNLPNVDKTGGLLRPHNVIAFPLYKGLGYSMKYSKQQKHPKISGKMGWWSDNLQNRDHTVVAGQSGTHDISVGTSDLTAGLWMPITDLHGTGTGAGSFDDKTQKAVQRALGNIYVCEFNRQRIKVDPKNTRYAYTDNIYINNVVPIDPTLSKYDTRLTNYKCDLTKGMYSPDNISQFDNIVYTDTPRDWLYFASNLRGGARETVNVMYSIQPVGEVKKEGQVKVQDGARFVYWNPANGPNSFLIVDDPVNVVYGKRTDLTLNQVVYPVSVPTFGAMVLHLIQMSDLEEINREWFSNVYINHYGFGDATVSVYVGGYLGKECLINPGGTTYARLDFYNNAGFDWEMKGVAINSTEIGKKAISGNDLLSGFVHTIQVPNAYNFLKVTIPQDLQKYITIVPSDHNVDTPPMFFDFESINVVTIRDGFKGTYWYKITVSSAITERPDLIGRMLQLDVAVDPQYFVKLPGPTDGTGIHDYTLQVPPIRFGVKYQGTSKWAGKVFYTSGYAHGVKLEHWVDKMFTAQEAKLISDVDLDNLRQISSIPLDRMKNLDTYWKGLTAPHNKKVDFVVEDPDPIVGWTTGYNKVKFTYESVAADGEFPMKVSAENGPDIAQLNILLRTWADQVPAGFQRASEDVKVDYADFTNQKKTTKLGTSQQVQVQGAYLSVNYHADLVTRSGEELPDQRLRPTDTGYMRIYMYITNTGTDIAYFAVMHTQLISGTRVAWDMPHDADLTLVEEPTCINITANTKASLTPGETVTRTFHVQYWALNLTSTVSRKPRLMAMPKQRIFATGASGQIDLTPTQGERQVTQAITTPLAIDLYTEPRPTVHLTLVGQDNNDVTLNVENSILPWTLYKYMDVSVFSKSPNAWTEKIKWQVSYSLANGTRVPWRALKSTAYTQYRQVFTLDDSYKDVAFLATITATAQKSGDTTAYEVAQSNILTLGPNPDTLPLWLVIALPVFAAFAAGLVWFLYRQQKKHGWKAEEPSKEIAQVITTPAERQAIELNTAPVLALAETAQAAEVVQTEDGQPAKVHYAVTAEYLMRGVVNVKIVDVDPTQGKVRTAEAELASAEIRQPKKRGVDGEATDEYSLEGDDDDEDAKGCWGNFKRGMKRACCCGRKTTARPASSSSANAAAVAAVATPASSSSTTTTCAPAEAPADNTTAAQ